MSQKNDVKPFLEEIMAIVIDFLDQKAGEKAIANQLKQKYQQRLPQWMIQGNPLIKKGLVKLIKGYIKQNSQINSYYLNRQMESVNQEDQSIEQERKPRKQRKLSKQIQAKQINGKTSSRANETRHHDNTSDWVVSKFEAPRKLEEIGVQEHMRGVEVSLHKSKMIAKQESQDEEVQPKKSRKRDIESQSEFSQQKPKKSIKKKKKTKVVPSESQDESSVSSEKPKKKSKAKLSKRQKKSVKVIAKKAPQSSEQEKQTPAPKKNTPPFNADIAQNSINTSSKKPFSRINVEEIGEIPQTLRDNTFEAKFKYGKGGDEWGKFGYEKLKDTRGQSFKKTKGKLKNKAFQGANIDFNAVNSIKL